jgi:hypothetical protein
MTAAIGKKRKKRKAAKPVVVRRNSVTRTNNVFGDSGSASTGEIMLGVVAGLGIGILAYRFWFSKITDTPSGPPTTSTGTTPPVVALQSCRADELVERRIGGVGGCGCQGCQHSNSSYRVNGFNWRNETI